MLDVDILRLDDSAFKIRLTSDGCSPDCSDPWPECSSAPVSDRRMSLEFFLSNESSTGWQKPNRHRDSLEDQEYDNHWCQYNNLSAAHRRLIDALWTSISDILNSLPDTPRMERYRQAVKIWSDALDRMHSRIESSVYAISGSRVVVVNHEAQPSSRSRSTNTIKQPAIRSVSQLISRVKSKGELEAMFMPGTESTDDPYIIASEEDYEKATESYMQQLLEHPVYQVY